MKSQPTGRVITGLAGLALILSLFLTWYSMKVGGGAGLLGGVSFDQSFSGWESLDVGDLFLFAVGIIALAAVAMDYMGKDVEIPIERHLLFKVLGGVALAWVIWRILDKPDTGPNVPGVDFGIDLGIGIFVALIGSVLLLVSAIKYGGGTTDGGGSHISTTPPAATAPPIQPPPGTGEQAEPPSATPDPNQPPTQY